jgi:hypothetical protein
LERIDTLIILPLNIFLVFKKLDFFIERSPNRPIRVVIRILKILRSYPGV